MVGGKIYSFRINDPRLIEYVESYKAKGGSLSGLINRLLGEYLFGNPESKVISEDYLKLKEFLRSGDEILSEWQKLKSEIEDFLSEKEIEIQEEKEKEVEDLTAKLKTYFEDIDDFEQFKLDVERAGNTVESAISIRLENFARKHSITYAEAKNLFFKIFPEFKEKIKEMVI